MLQTLTFDLCLIDEEQYVYLSGHQLLSIIHLVLHVVPMQKKHFKILNMF